MFGPCPALFEGGFWTFSAPFVQPSDTPWQQLTLRSCSSEGIAWCSGSPPPPGLGIPPPPAVPPIPPWVLAGCPDLYLRNVVQLMTTLLRASISRQPLARAGAQYLLHTDVPLSATPELMRALAPVGLQLHHIPSPTLREATQHYTGTPRLPESLGVVYLAYDAAVQGNRLGVAAIAWHWTTGVLFTFQTAMYAYRPSSSEAEWLARLLPLHPLRHWSGTVFFVTDSANTCTHRLTRGPCEQTLIAIYFRRAAAFHDGLKQRDLWLRAQHTTGLQDVLSQLNAEAHNLAQAALFKALPHTVPLAAALQGTTVATIDGAVVLDPAAHMDDLYTRATSRHPVPQLADWDSAAWAEVCLTGSLPEHDVRRVLLLRLLALAPPPPNSGLPPLPLLFVGCARPASPHPRSLCTGLSGHTDCSVCPVALHTRAQSVTAAPDRLTRLSGPGN